MALPHPPALGSTWPGPKPPQREPAQFAAGHTQSKRRIVKMTGARHETQDMMDKDSHGHPGGI